MQQILINCICGKATPTILHASYFYNQYKLSLIVQEPLTVSSPPSITHYNNVSTYSIKLTLHTCRVLIARMRSLALSLCKISFPIQNPSSLSRISLSFHLARYKLVKISLAPRLCYVFLSGRVTTLRAKFRMRGQCPTNCF